MLTIYSHQSSLKKKLTVVVVWFIAMAFSVLYFQFINYKEISFLYKLVPLILGMFMIAGILLRCKIARGFTLIGLYFIALFPLVFYILIINLFPHIIMPTFFIFSAEDISLFSQVELLINYIVWTLLFIIPIYFLSNEKAMEIFYIESNPKEHIFYASIAILLIILSGYYVHLQVLS